MVEAAAICFHHCFFGYIACSDKHPITIFMYYIHKCI